jgi:hypothetical protein
MNREKKEVRKILAHSPVVYQGLSQEDIELAVDRVWENLHPGAVRTSDRVQRLADSVPARPAVTRRRSKWPAIGTIAAAIAIAVLVPITIARRAPAVIEEIGGSRKIEFGEVVRSSGSLGETLVLLDGSRVEMRAASELLLERADNGVRIQLHTGGIIVNAAKQRKGHLYVRTKDVSVSVVGTVFLVNAEEKGSRVAVIEGEVHVQQGGTEKKLRPGGQVATNPSMEPQSLADEISWSRNVGAHLAMLQQNNAPAQTPGAQQDQAIGAGSIRGLVSHSETAAPIPGVEIRIAKISNAASLTSGPRFMRLSAEGLNFEEIAALLTGSMVQSPVVASTDESGRFVINNLADGDYLVLAKREGYYVRARTQPPLNRATAIVAINGGKATNAALHLTPSGSISGKVTDTSGKPITDAELQLYTYVFRNGTSTLALARTGSRTTKVTDDRGEYRIYEVPPGVYFVVAIPPRIEQRQSPRAVRSATQARVFVPTFHPGSRDKTTGVPITIDGRRDISGVDIRLAETPVGRLRGRVLSTLPEATNVLPSGVSLMLASRDEGDLVLGQAALTVQARADGTFDLSNVPYGRYDLFARHPLPVRDLRGMPNTSWAFGRTAIELNSEELRDLTVTVNPGRNVKGRVLTDGRPTASELRLSLRLAPGDSASRISGFFGNVLNQVTLYNPIIGNDGSFAISAIPEARYRVQIEFEARVGARANILPPDVFVEDIRMGGVSVYDSGVIDLTTNNDDASVEIRLATNGGVVTGSLRRQDGNLVPLNSVVLIPPASRGENPMLYRAVLTDGYNPEVDREECGPAIAPP